MSELKRCPFCGGEPCMHEHVFVGYSSTFGIVCLDCCAETRQFYNTEEEAAAAWNRRAQPENEPLTCEGCEHQGEYENEREYGYPSPCTKCKRVAPDNYRQKPERSEG